jgi:hypothetical protein
VTFKDSHLIVEGSICPDVNRDPACPSP